MQETGVIRCIDDLGRIAIPKDIRRKLQFSDGAQLEIVLLDGMVCFRKFGVQKDLKARIKELIEEIELDMPNAGEIEEKLEDALELLED